MARSTDVLAAGLLDVSDPGLSNKYFLRQVNLINFIWKFLSQVLAFLMAMIPNIFTQSWGDESEGSSDSIVKHKPLWSAYSSKRQKGKKKTVVKKKGDLYRTYGTRVIPV